MKKHHLGDGLGAYHSTQRFTPPIVDDSYCSIAFAWYHTRGNVVFRWHYRTMHLNSDLTRRASDDYPAIFDMNDQRANPTG